MGPRAIPSRCRGGTTRPRFPPNCLGWIADWASRAPSATNGRVSRVAIDSESRVSPKNAEEHERDEAAVLVRVHGPSTANGRERRDGGERHRHSREQRQATLGNGLLGAREDERQHRQDARADDGQDAAEVGEYEKCHCGRSVPIRRWAVAKPAQAARINGVGTRVSYSCGTAKCRLKFIRPAYGTLEQHERGAHNANQNTAN